MTRRTARRGNWMVFRWPLMIGLASLFGLVSALVGNDLWDVASWATLGGTVVVMMVAWRRG